MGGAEQSSNFLKQIIERDLADGSTGGRVVTRFPPEPNGYLHIGHAKAICMDFGLALEYGGTCHLRFDDTNPAKEETEYVDGIQADIRWLGFDWGDKLFFASDFFDDMYRLAEGLISDGLAYVDHLTEAEIREHRGTVTEPAIPSPYRDRSVAENLDLFRRMKAGEFPDGHCVLRARGDLAHSNMKLRDPLLYRIRHEHHHRTGDDWCIYPMYDYAHPLEDALEGVTHSLCSLEFQDNRAIYDWVVDNCAVAARPQQYEFARLAITYTMMSKRRLLKLVQEGAVSGWDDPRMPTLSGLRRRGVPPQAIRAFVERVGVAKTNSVVEMELFEHTLRDVLNDQAPRVMAVLDPLPIEITNWDADRVDWIDADLWPQDVPHTGTRAVPFTRDVVIERSDFAEVPPKGWRRLVPGGEVRLRHGYLLTCTGIVRGPDGGIESLTARWTWTVGAAMRQTAARSRAPCTGSARPRGSGQRSGWSIGSSPWRTPRAGRTGRTTSTPRDWSCGRGPWWSLRWRPIPTASATNSSGWATSGGTPRTPPPTCWCSTASCR